MSDEERSGGGSDGEEQPFVRINRAFFDADDDEEEQEGQGGPGRARAGRGGAGQGAGGRPPGPRLALHDFLRLIAGHVGEVGEFAGTPGNTFMHLHCFPVGNCHTAQC